MFIKKSFIFLGFVILFLPLLTAVQVDIDPIYKQGQSLTIKLSGNFLGSLLKNNIYFYRDTYTLVPFEFDLLKINQDYFISTTPVFKTPGNYSLVIKNTQYYTIGAQITSEDIIANFSISPEIADFSVKPGVLIANNAFDLELQNLRDNEIIVYLNKDNLSNNEEGFFSFLSNSNNQQGESYTLKAGEIKQVQLDFQNISTPVLKKIILSTENTTNNVFVYLDYSSTQDSEPIEINESNLTESNQTNLNKSNLTIESNQTSQEEKTPYSSKPCEYWNGSICQENEECDSEKVTAQDRKCCLGNCTEKKKSTTSRIIGIIIFVVLVALYIWFYLKKYKKVKNKPELLKVAQGKKK